MATPLITSIPLGTHLPRDLGSGSNVRSPANCVGDPTRITPAEQLHYVLYEVRVGEATSSASTRLVREKPGDLVGSWLASTEGMLVEADRAPSSTYARALEELKTNLGVTLTYVARCLALQRSAIYRWYEGRQPHPANRSRLETIREFAAAWRRAKLPSLRNYWDARVPGVNFTLGELLSAEALDIQALRQAISSLMSDEPTMLAKAPRLGFPGRKRDKKKDRERLATLVAPTSQEDDEHKED